MLAVNAARALGAIGSVWLCAACACEDPLATEQGSDPVPAQYALRGGWLAPRQGFPLDSRHGAEALARMKALGATHVAIGHDVRMPKMAEPKLVWGEGDEALRKVLRRARAAGLAAFLMPRIESPDFFEPPYPFRADIAFASRTDWDRFHADVEAMLVHYAELAAAEKVEIFGVGLELKRCVRRQPDRWRQIIAAVRKVYDGKLTYSANWYDEWEHVRFWDALDYIGVGAYFELHAQPSEAGRALDARAVAARWRPTLDKLATAAARVDKPILFTEIGYTGYRDCLEKPWEWAGKEGKNVAIDLERQALAYAGMLRAVAEQPRFAGVFLWRFYTDPKGVKPFEYAVEARPAETVVRRAWQATEIKNGK